jgi:Asp/Glu/hydantoin racemase
MHETPSGPWHVRTRHLPEGETVRYMPGTYYQVCQQGHNGKAKTARVLWVLAEQIEDEAHAYLIAAAPDLLRLLRRMTETPAIGMDLALMGTIEEARSVIARATGAEE